MTERQMLYGLSRLSFLTPNRFEALLNAEGSIEGVYNIEEKKLLQYGFTEEHAAKWKDLRHRQGQLSKTYHREVGQGIRFISRIDEAFPEKLKPFPGSPIGLYVKGKLPDPKKPSVAMVGARACSNYGRAMAKRLGRELAERASACLAAVWM